MKRLWLLVAILLSSPAFARSDSSVPQAPIEGLGGIAGLWYDPAFDGEGFNIIPTRAGLVVFFYGYTEEGQRLWLISEAFSNEIAFGQMLDLQMYEGSGGTYDKPAPSEIALSIWGRLKIEFIACDSARFELDGLDGVKVTQQVKLAGIMEADCSLKALAAPSGLAGLWYDPALDGEGFNVITTGDSTVIFYYGYTWDGERLWLISEALDGVPRLGITLNLKMYSAFGGTFDAPIPSSEGFSEWGNLAITFIQCNTAYARMSGQFGPLKKFSLVQLGQIEQSTCPESSTGDNVMLRVVLVTVE